MNLHAYLGMFLITILAYFAKGVLGFGEGLITVSLFLLFLDPKFVFPITLLLALIGGLYQFFYIRLDIDGGVIKIMFIPIILGVIIGTYLFQVLDAGIVKSIFAIFLIFYASRLLYLSILNQKMQKHVRANKLWEGLVGLASGIIDGLIGVGGVPVIVYLNHITFDKIKFRATVVSIFLLLGLSRIITYTYSGLIDFNIVKQVVYLTPAVIMGIFFGIKAHHLIDDVLFRKVVVLSLIVIGLLLLVKR